MLDLLVLLMIYATWISLFIMPVALMILRVFYVLTHQLNIKQMVMIVFLPCGIGLEKLTKEGRFKTLYRVLVIITFILLFFASLFLLYLYKS